MLTDPETESETIASAFRQHITQVRRCYPSWSLPPDKARELHVTDAYLAAGIPAEQAATLTRIGFTVLIGSQQLDATMDRARLSDSLDE